MTNPPIILWPSHDYGAYEIIMMIHELHKRGYEQLRMVSGMSPNGCAWRWFVYPKVLMRDSNVFEHCCDWIPIATICGSTGTEKSGDDFIAMADRFERQHHDMLALAKDKDVEYVAWFDNLVQHAERNEYPIAFFEFSDGTWSFTSGEPIEYPPFTPKSPVDLSDQDIITFALNVYDDDSRWELQYTLDYKGKKPSTHEIADTIRKALREHKGLVSHEETAYYKLMGFSDVKEKREVENGLEIVTSDGRKLLLEAELDFCAWGDSAIFQ